MYTAWPIRVEALTPCVGAAVVWHQGDRLNVTAVVKATFRFVPADRATLVAPLELVERERHRDRSPQQSLEAASDLAPLIPRADVLVHGSAHAESVRLRVWRDGPLVDKTLRVTGERPAPLVWERAAAHADNPVGVGAPTVVDPRDASRPAGFAPLAWNWPARIALLGGAERQPLLERAARYPDDFDFAFFHAAPPDQRVDFLAGDERILLEGWSAERRRAETQLPGARAEARAFLMTREGPTAPEPIALVADMLVVDAERELVSVVWRGHRAFAHGEADLAHLGILAGVAIPPHGIDWPRDPGRGLERTTLPAASAVFLPEKAAQAPKREQLRDLPFVRARDGAPPPEMATRPSDYLRAPRRDDFDGTQMVDLAQLAKQREKSFDGLPFAASAETRAELEARIPPRPGDAIPWVAAAPYDVGTHHWQVNPPQNLLIVIVKGSYDLVPGAAAKARERADFITGERFYGDDPAASAIGPDDTAIFKPKADVLLVGHAYPPERGAVATQVSFTFGAAGNRFERRIAVFGDRVWQRGIATVAGEPHAFDKIPLVYERAFGGPGAPDNPVGRGHGDSALMPNLELNGKLVTSPTDRRAPACFAPIAMEWTARWSLQGTYDKKWFKSRWPYFPADFDWSFFQSAPPEQRLEYLRGDEPYDARGVHPDLVSVRGTLPGERARAFVVKRGASAGFDEVLLRLDTATFDFDAMKVDLVWRGLYVVSDKDSPEVQAIFAMRQGLGEPERTVDQAYQLLLDTLTPKPEAEPEAPPPPPTRHDEEAEAARHAKIQELEANAARLEARYEEDLKKAGLTPEALDATPPADPKDLAAALAAAGVTQPEIDAMLEALEPPPPAADEPTEPEPTLRERVLEMLAQGASFAAFDFEETDLSDLDFSGRDLTRAQLQRGTFARASFAGAKLAEAQLGEGDFSAAVFDGADLTGADLVAAKLERASFKGAVLAFADLSDARGREADFTEARGDSILYTSGDWERCRFDRAEMTSARFAGARIGGASFLDAKVPKIVLTDALGPDARFDRAVMTAVRGDGCKMHRASLRNVDAPESIFENAELLQADLRGAILRGSSFVRASCLKANFAQADLVESRLERAKLTGAIFERANLMMSRLDGADLGIADLRGANLHACGMVDTNLLDAKMSGAITTKSSLVMKPFKS
jgi:uncharacterized protein YjbI with pentapeptide repeats